jgi:hypothetical protein
MMLAPGEDGHGDGEKKTQSLQNSKVRVSILNDRQDSSVLGFLSPRCTSTLPIHSATPAGPGWTTSSPWDRLRIPESKPFLEKKAESTVLQGKEVLALSLMTPCTQSWEESGICSGLALFSVCMDCRPQRSPGVEISKEGKRRGMWELCYSPCPFEETETSWSQMTCQTASS